VHVWGQFLKDYKPTAWWRRPLGWSRRATGSLRDRTAEAVRHWSQPCATGRRRAPPAAAARRTSV